MNLDNWSEAGSRPIVRRAGSPIVEADPHLCMFPGRDYHIE